MDIRKVKKLIEMLEESEIAEIEIHEGEESVRISRQSSIAGTPVQSVVQVPGAEATGKGRTLQETQTGVGTPAADAELEGHVVSSPMVGIFYEAPSPGKPPFVELGSEIKKGDIICIIEAMKIMNQVEADVSGVIARIMVENGDPVEYGQPLYLVRESSG